MMFICWAKVLSDGNQVTACILQINQLKRPKREKLSMSVDELYDVITLPGVQCPMALGFKSDEIRRMISIEY